MQGLPGSEELSDFKAWANIAKSSIGFTLLMLPRAIAKVGILPGVVGLTAACLANIWGLILVAKCKTVVEQRGSSESDPLLLPASSHSAKKLPESIWDSGYGYLDKVVAAALGKRAQLLCVFGLVVLELVDGIGISSVVVDTLLSEFPALRHDATLLAIGSVFIILSSANRLWNVAFLSAAALLLYFVIIVCLASEALEHHAQVNVEVVRTQGYDYGVFLATANFAFTSLPVSDRAFREMKNKSHFVYVAAGGYLTSLMFALFVGLVGYYGFGTEALETIHLNFTGRAKSITVVAVTASLLVSQVLLSVPLFMFMQKQLPSLHYMIVNSSVVCLQILLAYFLGNAAKAVGTLGTIGALTVAWLLPGLTFLSLSTRHERGEQLVAVIVMIFGVIGAATALASA